MKQLTLIGNLKMNMDKNILKPYFKGLKKISKTQTNNFGVCVPFVYLPMAEKMLKGTRVLFGAQNMYSQDKGAFTGEVSASMISDFGANIVIIGHSERRQMFGETNKSVNQKLLKAIESNITPILCVGETKEEKDAKKTKSVIKKEIIEGLKDVTPEAIEKMYFAYEPIWAIGSGLSATPKDAENICKYISETVTSLYNLENDNKVTVLYGGSLNEKNANEILSQPHIKGGLIGGACMKLESFEKIISTNIGCENE